MASVTCGKRTIGKCNYDKCIYGKNIMANVTEPPYHPCKIIERINTITGTLSLHGKKVKLKT